MLRFDSLGKDFSEELHALTKDNFNVTIIGRIAYRNCIGHIKISAHIVPAGFHMKKALWTILNRNL